jgi:hypothetical protein
MAATAGHRLTLNTGKMFKCLLLRNYKYYKTVEDHPMNIHVQFGFNHISEKKAFEHFPIGSNVNLCPAVVATFHISSFFSETTGPIGTKLSMNVPWMVLYNVSVFRSSRIFNMAARANNML